VNGVHLAEGPTLEIKHDRVKFKKKTLAAFIKVNGVHLAEGPTLVIKRDRVKFQKKPVALNEIHSILVGLLTFEHPKSRNYGQENQSCKPCR
jgi:hypothetical protein